MWGCFGGSTTKTPPHILFVTEIPKDPLGYQTTNRFLEAAGVWVGVRVFFTKIPEELNPFIITTTISDAEILYKITINFLTSIAKLSIIRPCQKK